MVLALLATAADNPAPYVGGGIGVAALVVAASRIAGGLQRLVSVFEQHLDAWGRHRKAQSKHWAESRALLAQLAEERRQRDADARAARRYLTEQRNITDRFDAIERRFRRLEGASADASSGGS